MPYKNISPTIWGPHLWKFMHYLTLSYPENPTEEDKDNLYNFFLTIQTVLPCEKCRYNFKSHLEKTPLTEEILSDNVKVIKWLFDIHNEVNKSTNKPVLLYDDFIKLYSSKPSETSVPTVESTQTIQTTQTTQSDQPKKQEINKETKGIFMDKLDNLLEIGKNNKVVIVMSIIIIILIMVYLNKKY